MATAVPSESGHFNTLEHQHSNTSTLQHISTSTLFSIFCAMEDFEKLVPEIYGVLMVLGIVMEEEETLTSLKQSGFDEPTAKFILETALEVQALTEKHDEKLAEINLQDQLKDEETQELVEAYLSSQGVEKELIEIVYLYHSYVITRKIAEQLILDGEIEGLSAKEIISNIRQLGELDRETAETIYITAMTNLGKDYTLENHLVRKSRRITWMGVVVLLVSLIEFIFDDNPTFLYAGLGLAMVLMIAGFIGVTKGS